MNASSLVVGLASLFVLIPAWLYILYNILASIDAGTFLWIVFGFYCFAKILATLFGIVVAGFEE